MNHAVLKLLAPLPALIVGVLVMRQSGVSVAIWGLQLAAGLLLTVICAALSVTTKNRSRTRPTTLVIIASAASLLLLATLVHPGTEGVRRWIRLGPVHLHAAFIALPVLLIVIAALRRTDSGQRPSWTIVGVVAVAAVALALQPDASQAIAFAVAVPVVLFGRRPWQASDWIATGLAVGCAAMALTRPDPLDAVPHVEGILGLAANAGTPWFVAAVVALILLPAPFIARSARRDGNEGVALAAYFAIACIASLVRPYPVPLLGYGLSPLLGYFIGLGPMIRQARPAQGEIRFAAGD